MTVDSAADSTVQNFSDRYLQPWEHARWTIAVTEKVTSDYPVTQTGSGQPCFRVRVNRVIAFVPTFMLKAAVLPDRREHGLQS